MLSARRKNFWFLPFPLLVLIMVILVALNKFTLLVNSTDVLYYGAGETQSAKAENFLVLPLIFGMVTLCFIPLSRLFGQLFTQVKPLSAYTFDIIGSLAGIACFYTIAYFALPPLLWFLVLAVFILLLSSRTVLAASSAMFLASIIIVWQLQIGTYWSPYYKIILHPAIPSGYIVDVNNAGGHQSMIPWQYKEPFYRRVYELFPGGSFHHALILGAGSGSDTATALAYGVQSVTAVEIDPLILQLGKQFNPDHPYSNPRVKLVVNDGRNFLENSTEHYDLIIFALPDSLTLTSSNTSLRLESFLLTQNSIATARAHLTSNGLLILYNFYRTNWLLDKLVNMVGHTFSQEPLISTYGGRGRGAVIMAGPRLTELAPGAFGPYHEFPNPTNDRLHVIGEGYYSLTPASTPATDDWPFLYLVDHSFPLLYIEGLAMVLVFALGGTLTLAPRRVLRRFDWHMFSLGAAFMLLEVRSLTTFSLLFGSTWLVNSLVFFAILSSVLLAILFNRRFKVKRIAPVYLLLFAILILNILLPPEALLLNNPVIRYILASALAFAPGLEYFSMLTGYRLLLIPVIAFYALALLLRGRSGQKAQGQEAEVGVPAEVA